MILIWKVDKQIQTSCPDYKPDPYTGEYPLIHCLVYHFETITENRNIEFVDEKEAIAFAEKAPLSCYDFVLDGKPLEDKRERSKIFDNITITDPSFTTTSGDLVIHAQTASNTLHITREYEA